MINLKDDVLGENIILMVIYSTCHSICQVIYMKEELLLNTVKFFGVLYIISFTFGKSH